MKCILKVKEWIQNLGLVDHPPITHDDDEGDDVADAFHHSENSVKNRYGKFCTVKCWFSKFCLCQWMHCLSTIFFKIFFKECAIEGRSVSDKAGIGEAAIDIGQS